MFNRSFETSAGSVVFPPSLPGKILIAKAEGSLAKIAAVPDVLALVERNIRTKDIPPFNNPYLLTNTEGTTTFINLSPYKSSLRYSPEGELIAPTVGDAGILLRRALLERAWSDGVIDPFFFNIDAPITIFSRWLSGLLRSNLTLSDEVATKVEALTAYYYYCLHIKEEELTARMLDVFTVKISRILRVPFQTLSDWFTPIGYLANLEDFCEMLKKHAGSISFRNIEKRLVWTLTSTSWFGPVGTKELIATSLEFPPAFIALVYAGINERTYRKAFLSQLIEREGRRLNGVEFTTRVDDITRQAVRPKSK